MGEEASISMFLKLPYFIMSTSLGASNVGHRVVHYCG